MSSTDRQNRLLLAEDWRRIYQSFKYADFQSYDFDNLRRTMINYIRQNYPEDFNDYIESSEYLALIDLIAFLGQNLAFRTDLNARENFIETAERRESVLRLARLISYNPKRNVPANGLLKIESVSTSEDIFDSNGNNLGNQTIIWNDGTNPNWYEQFIKILNAALPVNNTFGRPVKKLTIDGVITEQYRFNGINTDIPSFSFSKNLNNINTVFEVVSTDIDIDNTTIKEEDPLPGNKLAMLYRDNGQGSGSSNTGFFFHFREGRLKSNIFAIENSAPNTIVNIDTDNVNNTDVWLYKLDSNQNEDELWTKVDSTEGNNIIYNSTAKGIRSIYSVLTRIQDRISLIFSDGVFGELPKGTFKIYYRTSANRNYRIQPSDLIGINIQVPYTSRSGKTETLNLILELKDVIDNADTSEDNNSIKSNAPSTYYTQNRLITGEDYNVGPLGIDTNIIKTKAVNRTSSGISRYYDLRDATGKYSNTNMFGSDGSFYREEITGLESFEFSTRTDIEAAVNNIVLPIIKSSKIKNFYYTKFSRNDSVSTLNITWTQVTNATNQTTGYFINEYDFPISVSSYTQGLMKYVEPGALLKFIAPDGYCFDKDNNLKLGFPSVLGDKNYIWTKVISVDEDGTVIDNVTGLGPVVFNDLVPDGVKLVQIIPILVNTIVDDVVTQIVDQAFSYKTFGLRYDVNSRMWKVIVNNNLDVTSEFELGKTGDSSNQKLDNSWLLLFETDGEKYTITYRGLKYVFQSDKQIRFYYDSTDKIYDSKTGKIVKDTISILSNNNQPDSLLPFTQDWVWQVAQEYRDASGYIDSKKLEISFFDSDDDGVIDNPDIFDNVVAPTVNPNAKYIFAKKLVRNNIEVFDYVDADIENIKVVSTEIGAQPFSNHEDGTVFYIVDKDLFKVLSLTSNTLTLSADYRAYVGRNSLRFQYVHAANENRRIDPSSSNIIDLYLLTKTYDRNYRKWLKGEITIKPLPPSSDSLYLSYGSNINQIKSVSDEVIYHPVKYKPIFGSMSDIDLQAVFKIVKNPNRVVNDNDVKTRVISAVNEFFALENWDFGETFYFSELAAYIINELSPDISSIVLVPRQESQSFGSLYELKSENDEIFISSATVDDVQIIDSITASRLKATGIVVTSDEVLNTGVQSEDATSSIIITGGSN
jgi:hypothetical protein